MYEEILETQVEDTLKDRFLTFEIGGESYGIDLKYVKEIVGLQPITPVPELPEYIRGIINLRGKIIPVLDVRLRFKKPFREYTDRTCVIVIDVNEVSVGLIVDSVSEVMTIHENQIEPPPELNKFSNPFIKGIGKAPDGVKLLIDCYSLLNNDEFEKMSISE